MEEGTDWLALWHELALRDSCRHGGQAPGAPGADPWLDRARNYDASIRRRWAASSDSSRETVMSMVPDGASVLDIGAGTGQWAMLLARKASKVTAVEPSPGMAEVMRENLAAEGIHNVDVVQAAWPDAAVQPHDFSLCSHSMYGQLDFAAFVNSLLVATRHTCFAVMRIPTVGSVMAQATQRVYGHMHDSPNGIVAFNALLQMGLFPSVVMERGGHWDPWSHGSLEEALAEVKGRLHLPEHSPHDEFLTDLLSRELALIDGRYVWPPGVCSALIYWQARDKAGTN